MDTLQEILTSINFKANNLEETCCGIRHMRDYYSKEKNRNKLISEIETLIDEINQEVDNLKHA